MSIPDICIETERLILRPPQRDDFEDWVVMCADAEVMRLLGGTQPRSVVWQRFTAWFGAWHLQGFAPFAVIEKASGQWLGRIGPLQPEGWPGTEIGWGLARAAWGRGYAVEAARAAADWAFEVLGWSEIIHCIAPDNIASQAVATKLGSINLGPGKLPAPHEDAPTDIWGQSRAQWYSRRRA